MIWVCPLIGWLEKPITYEDADEEDRSEAAGAESEVPMRSF